ncbi:DUF2147 domain-containing protein [Acidocella aquatica]|uniref:DUF2147 domain-containing protein n=1 Tax=Acidocella aquatica TaxID=1922313 RepID=UPI0024E0A379|nr:DUF2147 domain-containing protein [Acidocella aquatica]
MCGGTAALAASASPTPPIGNWLTADHSAVIQVGPCGGQLCGRIVGIALKHQTDPMPVDWRGQPQCGEAILQTALVLNNSGASAWVGTVLDPRNGNVYQASIALDMSHHLRMRGYLGLPIFGQTQTWLPYNGQIPVGCKLPRAPG